MKLYLILLGLACATADAVQPTSSAPEHIEAQSKPQTPTEIARAAFPSVVLLAMQDARGQPISLGSGFFVAKDTVATNFHVIDGAAGGYAKIIGQPAKLTIQGIVGLDAVHDLALIQLSASSAPALPVAEKMLVSTGDAVFAIGNPRGLEGTFSQGIVSSVRELGPDRVLQITAPISPGSSGGPVLDQTGTVVGVSVASITNGQNLNFAIPAEYVATLQKDKIDLRPFKSVLQAKVRKSLLNQLGNQQPRTGVVGENLTYDNKFQQAGEFSFSLHNKLSQDVATIYGIIIFYDVQGEPIDTFPINHQGTIPAHAAKRISGQVHGSVEEFNAPQPIKGVVGPYSSRLPKGKVEFRILDFSIANE